MASERRFDFRFSEATRIKVYDNGVVNRKNNLTTVCGGGSASQLRKRCFVKSGGLSHASPEALDLRYRLLFAAKARLFSTDVSVRFEAEDRGIKNRGNEPSSRCASGEDGDGARASLRSYGTNILDYIRVSN